MKHIAIMTVAGLALLAAAARADDKGTVTKLGDLTSTTPANWKSQEVTVPNRIYHFILPKAEGDKYDAELLVFHFGQGQGGSAADNIKRWKGMITPADGKKIDDVSKVEELKIGGSKATMLVADGTYNYKKRPFDPDEVPEKREKYRLVGVVVDGDNGAYFIRATGPAKTMDAHKKGFDEWLKGLK